MNRLLLVLVGFTVFVASVPAAPVPKGAEKPLLYYPVQSGAKWVYVEGGKEVEYCVTKIQRQQDGSVVVTEEGGPMSPTRWHVSPSGLSAVSAGSIKFDPPCPLLKLPLPADRKWEVAGGGQYPKGLFAAQVLEEVKVPAGTFRAIRVDVEWTGNSKGTFWLAPNVGFIKASGDGLDRELKSFSPGKD